MLCGGFALATWRGTLKFDRGVTTSQRTHDGWSRCGMSMKSIGFGLERVAWLALKWPRTTAVFFLVLLAIAGLGLTRLSYDENLRDTFVSDSDAYKLYVATTSEFVDPENETIVLVEGDRLGEPDTFRKLQDLQLELQVADGVASVYSLFALRSAPNTAGDAPLLVNNTDNGLSPELATRIRAHPVLGSKLLSADGKAMVFVVTPAEQKAPLSVARVLNADIEQKAAGILAGTGLRVTVTGYPALRVAILELVKRDQLVLNGVGALIGFIMSLIAFRSMIGATLTAAPAILAGLTVLGGMGLLGVNVTVMSNVVPVLVMILGYADGMHLSHAWKNHRDRGKSILEAEWLAQKEVGAACMLTALTVSGAFASLALTDVAIVRNFAWTGAAAMLVACPVVLVGHALSVLLVGRFWTGGKGSALDLLHRFEEPSARLGRFVVDHARGISIISGALFVVLGLMYVGVPPEHSVREHLPTNNPANAALGRYDQNFGGALPVQVVIPGNGNPTITAEALAKIGAVHRAVAAVPEAGDPLSLWSLVEWIGGGADAATAGRLEQILGQLSPEARSRFISQSGATLVTASLREAPTDKLDAIIEAIETAARAAGGNDIGVTGVTVVTNREAARTIANLNWSLATAVFSDIILMVIAFRNIQIGLVSVLANTLPLFATGALLYLRGKGMQFTSVIALTVAFGIAVDDTIHYINRFLILRSPDEPLNKRLIDTSREVGPVLIGTTIIVLGGLSTTFTSGLPTVTLFGWIAGITLVVAAAGDLIVMPALVSGYGRRWFEKKPPAITARTEETPA
jgi:predicted RND superfamily exporter protein